MHAFDDLICAVLRNERPRWPWATDAKAISEFLAHAEASGVQALLHHHLGPIATWPLPLRDQLRLRAVHLAMWELRHQQVLTRTLGALSRIGIEPVLFKGTALAYSLYADPALRTRSDTDMIVPADRKEAVHAELVSEGYRRDMAVSGEFVSYQSNYTLERDDGTAHTLDTHWKINNSEVLSRLFSYQELRAKAQPAPRLCAQAWAAAPVHALLLACMHRATHKQVPYYHRGKAIEDPNRLIWLYDIHLLALAMGPDEWDECSRLATTKGLRAVCAEGLREAQLRFNSPLPEKVLQGFGNTTETEKASRYLAASTWRQTWMDFWALDGATTKLRMTAETLFPSEAYMRARFDAAVTPLAWLYLRRAARGVAKRLRARNPP
jgi:hypothetical protein